MKIGRIEKDVPLPLTSLILEVDVSKLEVGDSFLLCPEGDETLHFIRRTVVPAVVQKLNRSGMKAKTTIRVKENGVRIWRVG